MKISVITVNYNSSEFTIKLSQSLQKYTHKSLKYELIVVDNASNSQEREKLAYFNDIANVKVIYNRKNTGFSAGNMLGVQYSDADYYFFLNNDTELQNDILSIFYEYAHSHKDYALLTAQLHLNDGSITTSFKKFPTLANKLFGNALVRMFKKDDFPSNKAHLTEPTDVGVVSGSCMFFDAKVFDKIGGLETIFFLYCEEEDISKRVWESGYKVRFLPQAKLIHYEGGSTQRNLDIEKEYYISYYLLLDKHFGFFSSRILKCLTVFKLFRRSFRSSYYFKLFTFVLRGAPIKDSLRYKQPLIKRVDND
jgi:GT2 family glycosyltransferase